MKKRWRSILLLIAGAFLAIVVVITMQLVMALQAVRAEPKDNLQWSIYQLGNEFARFQIAALTWRADDPASDAMLRGRFDILYSRIELLNAPLFHDLARAEYGISGVEQLEAFRDEVDQLIGGSLDGPTVEQISAIIRQSSTIADQFAAETLQIMTKRSDDLRAELAKFVEMATVVFLGILTALILAMLLLARQQQRLKARSGALAETAHDLLEAQRIAMIGRFTWDYVADRVEWSDQMAKIYQLPVGGQMNGDAFSKVLHPDDRADVEAAEAAATAEAVVTKRPALRNVTYRIIRADGSTAHMQASAEITVLENGRRSCMTSVVRDVTEEYEQRYQLQESQRLLSESNRLAKLGTFKQDLVGDATVWSEQLYRLADFPEERYGEPNPTMQDVLHPDDIARINAFFANIRSRHAPSGPVPFETQFRVIWRDGSIHHLRGNGECSFDETGLATEIAGTLQDVTERVEQEIALQAAKTAAEDATRAKSEFLAVMSHELRTPLNGVLGMLSTFEDTELDDEQKNMLALARSSADSLLVLLNDILDLSKIEAGKLELESTAFELRPLVRSVVHLYATNARSKDCFLDSVVADDLPDWLQGDAARLRQIMLNFVSNAIKFTSEGGVMISAKRVDIGDGDDIRLRIEVNDTGIGIAKDQQRDLFAPFSQLDRSYSRRFGGTGLGLSICKDLAELMDGTIGLVSDEGKGSTFWIELPLREAEPEHSVAPAEAATVPHRKILVAEDNTTNQLVVRRLLEKLGHSVDVVSTGLEAVQAVGSVSYDLVLMDISMPVMDGIEATKRIRSLPQPVGSIQIIALTANAMESDRQIYLAAGMNGFVSKPIVQAKLVAALQATVVAQSNLEPEPSTGLSERLASIENEVGPEIMPKLIAAYQADLKRALEGLQLSGVADDLAQFGRYAHSIRSISLGLDFSDVCALAEEIENQARSGIILNYNQQYQDVASKLKPHLHALENLANSHYKPINSLS